MHEEDEYRHVPGTDPATVESICGEYGGGKGCIRIALDAEIPLQTVIRVVRAEFGGTNVRL